MVSIERLTPFATQAYSFKDLMLLSIESIFERFFILGGPREIREKKLQN
jgi:hypothetical protein